MRLEFLVLTVKKLLKSVYIYGSYRKNKIGVPFFWTIRYRPGQSVSTTSSLCELDTPPFPRSYHQVIEKTPWHGKGKPNKKACSAIAMMTARCALYVSASHVPSQSRTRVKLNRVFFLRFLVSPKFPHVPLGVGDRL